MKTSVPGYAKYLFFFLIWIALTFCVKSIKEPDLWWQVRTGEHIIDNQEVPKTDVFSFTYEGEPWINVKWFTEVVMAAVARIFGPELIFLLQAFVLIGIFFLFTKIKKILDPTGHPYAIYFLIALADFLFIISYRINGRPEMMSHLLTAGYLFLFFHFLRHRSALIWALVPLQLFWANSHEAYGVGMVMSIIFLVTFWIDLLVNRGTFLEGLKLTGIVVLSMLAVVVNPNFSELLLHPLNIFGQLKENQFTYELSSFMKKEYWSIFSVLNVLAFFVGLWKIFDLYRNKNSKQFEYHILLGFYPVLFLAFFYLSLQSYRNIPFFQIVNFPILMIFVKELKLDFLKSSTAFGALAVFLILLYISIPTNLYYKTLDDRNRYGLGLNMEKNPYSAAEFVRKNNIKGKCFSDYLSSSYLLWHLQPEFKTYLDLRDLDIFPAKFIDNNFVLYQSPGNLVKEDQTLWDYARSFDNFAYVVNRNAESMMNLNRFLHKNEDYELVYADQLNSIFLNNTLPENQQLIKEKGFKSIGQEIFQPLAQKKAPVLAQIFNYIFWPFYTETKSNKDFIRVKQIYFSEIGTNK